MEGKEDELTRLREENQALRGELASLKSGIRLSSTMMTSGGAMTRATTIGYSSQTIMGLEELILQLAPDGTIGYLNPPMAKLLGVPSRQKALGSALDDWDNGPLGKGTLKAVVQAALSSDKPITVEKVFSDLDEKVLPPAKGKRPASATILRFAATEVKGRVELIIQDVTRLRWLEETFARYVPPEVIEQMMTRTEEDFMNMERRVISILFVDMRGFTKMTQSISPGQLQQMVNSFLSNMVKCIQNYNGTVDKFVGDEVMALFGAPIKSDDHALQALLTALQMHKEHSSMMEQWAQDAYPSPGIGIGIATGPAIIGNIGTPARMDFTALGHTVNLAARLCSMAKAGQVLTVKETFHSASQAMKHDATHTIPSIRFSPMGEQRFKNIDKPVTVLSVREE